MGSCRSKDIQEGLDAVKDIFLLLREFSADMSELDRERKINYYLLHKKKLTNQEKDVLYYVIEKNNKIPLAEQEAPAE